MPTPASPICAHEARHKAGLVDRSLQARGLTEQGLARRMALRCLWTLQREISIDASDTSYRAHVLALLWDSLKRQTA